MYSHDNFGTCSRRVLFDIQAGRITECRFEGGCAGNTQGVARLVKGRTVDEVIELLHGIQCQNGTSCPDQLSRALREWKQQHGEE